MSTVFFRSVTFSGKFLHHSVRNELLRTNLFISDRNSCEIFKIESFFCISIERCLYQFDARPSPFLFIHIRRTDFNLIVKIETHPKKTLLKCSTEHSWLLHDKTCLGPFAARNSDRQIIWISQRFSLNFSMVFC